MTRRAITGRICLVIVVSVSTVIGARSYFNRSNSQVIASLESTPFLASSALNILEQQGIGAMAARSHFCTICVSNRDVKKATEILTADAKLHPTRYKWVLGYKGALGLPKLIPWKKIKINDGISEMDASKVIRADPLLIGFDQMVAKQKIVYVGKPILREISYFPLDYIDEKSKTQIAYKVVAKYGYNGKADEFRVEGWSYDLGRAGVIDTLVGSFPKV